MNKVLEYLQSDKGKIASKLYFEKLEKKDKIVQSQIKRFHLYYSHRIDEIIGKIREKYNSINYSEREYSLGREPNEYLYSFLFEVAKTYGEKTDLKEDFLWESYQYEGYIFNLYQGQGSFILINKI